MLAKLPGWVDDDVTSVRMAAGRGLFPRRHVGGSGEREPAANPRSGRSAAREHRRRARASAARGRLGRCRSLSGAPPSPRSKSPTRSKPPAFLTPSAARWRWPSQELLFFRGKDRVDLERLVAVREELDRDYVRRWIVDMMGEDDERVRQWDETVRRFAPA